MVMNTHTMGHFSAMALSRVRDWISPEMSIPVARCGISIRRFEEEESHLFRGSIRLVKYRLKFE